MKLNPLGKNIIVKQEEAKNKTESGIITGNTQKPNQGVVLAIGDEVEKIKKGDKIIFSGFGRQPMEHEGEQFLMLKEHEILATIK
jgi:chaperonin GroES